MPKSVAQLQEEDLPHTHLMQVSPAAIAKLINAGVTYTEIRNWLHKFLPPSHGCPNGCSAFVEWGISHGHVRCTGCGYPGVRYHREFEDMDLTATLLFHPDQLEEPRKQDELTI